MALEQLVGADSFQGIEDRFPALNAFNTTSLPDLLNVFWWRVKATDEWFTLLIQEERVDVTHFEVFKRMLVLYFRDEVASLRKNLDWWSKWCEKMLLAIRQKIEFCTRVDALWSGTETGGLQFHPQVDLLGDFTVLTRLEEKFDQAMRQESRIADIYIDYHTKKSAEYAERYEQTKKLQKIVIGTTLKKFNEIKKYLKEDERILSVLRGLLGDFDAMTFEFDDIYGK